jgi:hypothetical protein
MTTLTVFLLAFGVCNGLTASSQPNMLLGPLRDRLEDYMRRGLLSPWIAKPLLLCETCMASFWGLLCFFLLLHRPLDHLRLLVPFILCLAIANYALWTALSLMRVLKDTASSWMFQHPVTAFHGYMNQVTSPKNAPTQ